MTKKIKLSRIPCDTVREAKVVGGQKIRKMGRQSVKYPGQLLMSEPGFGQSFQQIGSGFGFVHGSSVTPLKSLKRGSLM